MNFRTLLGLCAVVLTLCGTAFAEKPNIILFMADDLGVEGLSSYGSADYQTPRLDALAEGGIRFTHCYSQPLCTPSRVQIMTGRYNFRNYVNFGVLLPTEETFAHLLKNAGYATAVTGKWQLYGFDTRQAEAGGDGSTPEQAGFDEYCLWQVKRPRKDGERYADPLVTRTGGIDEVVKDGYGPDEFCTFAEGFIERNVDSPFFLYYPMALTHDPFVPTPDTEGWSGDRYAKSPDKIAGMIAYMDNVVGRVVDKLDALGLRENTVVLFTTDNGTHPSITTRMKDGSTITGNKGKPTDAGTHVPLIVSWPGTAPEGRVLDDLVDFSDFLPTVVELAGASLPEDRELDGHSFAPQLRGEAGSPREWAFCHYNPNWGGREPARFARTQRWKLYDDGRFYDVPADPLEESPLPLNSLSDDARVVRATLENVLARYGEPITTN